MKSLKLLILIVAVGVSLLITSFAFAGVNDAKTWFIGAQAGYFGVPTSIFESAYESHSNVGGFPYGIQAGYSWEFVEVVGMVENWTVIFPDANWRGNGDPIEDSTDLRNKGFNWVSLEIMARFKIKAHEIVQPIFGIGLGLGITYGKLETRDYGEDWEEFNLPVVPVIDLLAGVRFVIPENVALDLNIGIKDGLYAGLACIFYY